ncbi:C-C chemokine receptor type 6 [Anguilla anguilla]|uniref:C-C chemokine receptor type 6 n=1 Tax=Anguilla anguilla TaxID=7936 RepID=UPI0015B08F88|nr:C-C chemokine receptor type 6 [Anguilla anguilla]XP_035261681.1 C-C chemokine receptor type 6 [Anguilla anguilla]XP_035261691.1 C-C chemokine receptor type 6 [Anguilla anguilla]
MNGSDYNFDYYGDGEESYDYDDMPCDLNGNHETELMVQAYVHSIICILGFLGNILVIITFAFYKKAKSMTDVYLLNVALADLLLVMALPLIIYNERNSWSMGAWVCKLLRGVYSINLYSCMLLLACISSDRYIAIVQARRSFRFRSQALFCSRLISAAVWVLAVALSVPTFLYNDRYEAYSGRSDANTAVCYFRFDQNETARLVKVLVPSTQVAVGFFLPLLVMVLCYSSIVATLLQAQNFHRHKAVRVVIAVVGVFIVCHLPYNVTLLCRTVALFKKKRCGMEKAAELALRVTETLAYLHCCLNPVLYAFIGVNFRNHFRKILVDLWCLGKKYIYGRRSSSVTSEFYISARKSTDGSNNEHGSSFTI